MTQQKARVDFRAFMITEYECILREAGGSTVGQDGWGSTFNAIDTKGDINSTLLDSVTKYAELATTAESQVGALKLQMRELQA